MTDLKTSLSKTSYPGRGLIFGMHEDGRAVMIYFIMGRSENSRNRVFVKDGDALRTQARDASKMKDPSLIIYAPMRVLNNHTIVTNGDQTDTIYACVKAGGTFEAALRTREFEPDAPNFTPRVSGIMTLSGGEFSYKLSILKHGCGCERFFFEYERPIAGLGHFLHTYDKDGAPIPSFIGEPERVNLQGDLAETAWAALDPDNKVALYLRLIDPKTGAVEERIVNR